MNNNICFVVMMCIMLLSSATTHAANTAPTTTPSAQKNEIIDTSGKTIDITASGGDCDAPNQSCQWTKDGSLVYEWSYSGLQGTPPSGSEGTTLKIKRDQSGVANVTVKAKQKWKEPGGKADTTTFMASSAVKISVQKPTSISFVSSSANSDGSGGAFKFTVKDQGSNPIKSASLSLTETISNALVTYTDLSGVVLAIVPIVSGSGIASYAGTDSDGNIVDTPVGVQVSSLTTIVNDVKKSIKTTFTLTHKYDDIVTPDSYKYSVNLTQNQAIKQKAVLNADATVTTSTESVTP